MQYCLATVLRSDGQAVGVTAVVTRCRGMDRARQRLASLTAAITRMLAAYNGSKAGMRMIMDCLAAAWYPQAGLP